MDDNDNDIGLRRMSTIQYTTLVAQLGMAIVDAFEYINTKTLCNDGLDAFDSFTAALRNELKKRISNG